MNLEIRPDEVIAIFDNGGFTLDNYTVSIQVVMEEDVIDYTLTCNSMPFHGIGMAHDDYVVDIDALDEDSSVYDEEYAKTVGKEIEWEDLPEDVKMFACNVVKNINQL